MKLEAILRASIIVAASAALAWEGLVTYFDPGQASRIIKRRSPRSSAAMSTAVITEGANRVARRDKTATVVTPEVASPGRSRRSGSAAFQEHFDRNAATGRAGKLSDMSADDPIHYDVRYGIGLTPNPREVFS